MKSKNRQVMKVVYVLQQQIKLIVNGASSGLPWICIQAASMGQMHHYTNIPASIFRADKPKIDPRRQRRQLRQNKKMLGIAASTMGVRKITEIKLESVTGDQSKDFSARIRGMLSESPEIKIL